MEQAKVLLAQGADIDLPDAHGLTPLILGKSLSIICCDQYPPFFSLFFLSISLLLAFNNNNKKMVQLLIDRGASLYSTDANGNTPLHLCLIKQTEGLKVLAKRLITLGIGIVLYLTNSSYIPIASININIFIYYVCI